MTNRGSRLLLSVRDVAEARVALAAAVDLIDIKEPRLGSLGAASVADIQAIANVVEDFKTSYERHARGRPDVSVALGELLASDMHDAANVAQSLANSEARHAIQFAKVGLSGCASRPEWPEAWSRCFEFLPVHVRRVACVYADHRVAGSPTLDEIVRETIPRGATALLIDTFDKRGPGLPRLWTASQIANAVDVAREQNLLVVLAGQLTIDYLPEMIAFAPDYIAVRGAACSPDRNGQLDAARLRSIRVAMASPP